MPDHITTQEATERYVAGKIPMSERWLRLMLAGAMFVVLFLPWHPPPPRGGTPNWMVILTYSVEGLFALPQTRLVYVVGLFCRVLFFLKAPILIGLNLILALASSAVRLRTAHRVLVLALCAITWYLLLTLFTPRWRSVVSLGTGFWSYLTVAPAAALLELGFVVRDWRGKSRRDEANG